MDSVTLCEASEDLPGLLQRVRAGEEVVIVEEGKRSVRLVREAPPLLVGKRVLTPEQERALETSMAILRRGWPMAIGKIDRDEIYAERFERQHKPGPR